MHLFPNLLLTLALLAGSSAHAAEALETTQAHSTGIFNASKDALVPGETVSFGLHIKLDPEWHTYWKNPGDSASAPILNLVVPAGYETTGPFYPPPVRIPVKHLVSFGYEGETILSFDVKVPAGEVPGEIRTFKLEAEWLVCKEECIPALFDFSMDMKVAASASDTVAAPLIAATRARQSDEEHKASHVAENGDYVFEVPAPEPGWKLKDVFPFPDMPLANSNPAIKEAEGRYQVRIVAGRGGPGGSGAIRLLTVWQPAESSQSVSIATVSSPSSSGAAEQTSIGLMLLFAFIGGFILNLMPCVFPVLVLKLFSLIRISDQPKSKVMLSQLSYQAGILVSLWLLAGILVAIRATGQSFGWGFQLQSPWFVAVLVVLFFIIGLNFLGLLEFNTRFAGVGQSLTMKKGLSGSFFTGVLAVVVASPCTAPFMGAAMGYALAQSPLTTFFVFTSLGLGLGLPYLFFGLFPTLARKLPKPGNWMIIFKEFMAFPMWGTMVWLLFVYNQQAGSLATSGLMALLTFVGLCVWALHRLKAVGRIVVAAFAVLLASVTVTMTMRPVAQANDSSSERWVTFSESTLAELRAANVPVFINFTAAWCISCQVNDQTTFQSAEIRDYVEEKKITMMKADWTNYDETIGAVLKRFGRAGVPLYLYYAPGAENAIILPEVLTPSLFKESVVDPDAGP